jgi:predicted methyltransferase
MNDATQKFLLDLSKVLATTLLPKEEVRVLMVDALSGLETGKQITSEEWIELRKKLSCEACDGTCVMTGPNEWTCIPCGRKQ